MNDRKSSETKKLNTDYNELKWEFALKNSNIGIWDFDADLNRVFYSDESKKIIGYDNDFGDNPNDWNDKVHPDDKAKYLKDFEDHLNGITPFYENEHRILCKNGRYKWVLDKGKIIKRDSNNNPKRIIGTHIDITEQKESELANANSLNIITEQNNKLKNFAHIVTHNLKSHSANFENLLEFYVEADSIKEKEELVQHLITVSDSLSKTIKNLNKIVSIQTKKDDKIDVLNVYDYINSAIKLLEVKISKNKAVIINKVDQAINIGFNPAYLESIFQNLLSNAIKYKHPERNPHIEFNSNITDQFIVITIKDNGLGINLDKYGKVLFDLYKTFHKNENSEGVGLYLIKNQIEAFGGTIEVDSKVDVGSKFMITFPKLKQSV